MTDSIFYKTALEVGACLERGEVSAVELTQAVIDRTAAVDASVGAFNSINAEDALAQAQDSDKRRSSGQCLGPLDGIPVSLKDVIAVKNSPLTCSSKMLQHYVSPYDAHVTEKLKAAGAVLWGRLNMDEFAMGSSTENSCTAKTANPWNLECVPGGSSGGSAAAVAGGETVLALGSDTGGSIRQPASFCGIVGMKPTYGMVSRYGLAAFASSLDQIGPMTRSVGDAALLLQTIAGHDQRDSTSLQRPVPDYLKALREPEKKAWRIGIPQEYFAEGLDDEVKVAVKRAIEFYREQGCEITSVSLPNTELAVPVYYVIATAEASSNLARYDGVLYSHRSQAATNINEVYFKSRAEGFGPEVKRRVILGTYVLSSGYYDAYYLRAQKVRALIRNDFVAAFKQVDVLLTPTAPTPAFKSGEKTADPLAMYLSDIYTISVNLAGLPGISIPCGMSDSGLPIGLQLIGRPFGESDLLTLAQQFECAHDYAEQHPLLNL